MIRITPPEYYIKTVFKKREGFRYKQPYQYLNNTEINYKTISNFKSIFGVEYSEIVRENHYYDEAIKALNTTSGLWANENEKIKAFNVIHNFIKNGSSKSGSSITPLLPFEIYMMNDGFEMVSFNELNAIDPSFSLIIDKSTKREIEDGFYSCHAYTHFKRFYRKEGKTVSLGFGYGNCNFYFTIDGITYFQVDNDFSNYNKAINGFLKPL